MKKINVNETSHDDKYSKKIVYYVTQRINKSIKNYHEYFEM